MIRDMALKLATKDFISGGVLHWHIIGIKQGPIYPPTESIKGGGEYIDTTKREYRKWVEVTFQYGDEIYIETKYIDKDIEVTTEMVSIQIIDNYPKVTIEI